MAGKNTTRMLRYFEQRADMRPLYCSSLFQAPAENYFSSSTVQFDVQRNGERLMPAVKSLSSALPLTTDDGYTNKEFEPPIIGEEFSINSQPLIDRAIGDTPFDDVNFVQNLLMKISRGIATRLDKARRTNEYQAAQVLQTGVGTLLDIDGSPIVSIDYQPKATHFATVSTSWGAAGATIYDDLRQLIDVVEDDGQSAVTLLVFGSNSYEHLISDEDIRARLDNRRIDQGSISPMQMLGNGLRYRGTLDIGSSRVDIATYNNKYQNTAGAMVPYLDPDKVLTLSDGMRLDACFGDIPNVGAILGYNQEIRSRINLPRRINLQGSRGDLITNVFMSNDGEQIRVSMKSRPIFIPTSIDRFGCLTTVAP